MPTYKHQVLFTEASKWPASYYANTKQAQIIEFFIFSDWSEKMFLIYKLEDFNAPFTKVKIANVLY